MGATHLAPLIDREAPLPPRFAARAEAWAEAAAALADRLTDALGAETVPGGVSLTVKSAAQVRTRKDVVVVPMGGAFFAVSTADAVLIADRLLRAEPSEDASAIRPLDVILMGGVAAETAECAADAFATAFALPGKPRLGWPPAAPEAAPFLCAAFALTVSGRPVMLRLLIAGPADAYAAPEAAEAAPCPRLSASVREAKAPVSAVLDSWRGTGAEAAGFSPGAVLPLPGASVEALDVVLALPGGPLRIASAELGKARGQRAVRLTSPIGFG